MRNRHKKSNRTQNWYSIRSLMSEFPEAKYYVAYGERKNGKTYSAKDVLIDCVQEGRTFMYVRRTHKMIVRRKMEKLFADMQDVCIKRLGTKIEYLNNAFVINADSNPVEIGYCTSLEDAYDDKGIPFNTVKYVLFDEFIDYWYLNNEIELFLHTIANIVRDEDNQGVKIMMLGNTISMNCPYFDFFGITVRNVKRGRPQLYVNPKGGIVAVEHTKTKAVLEQGVKKSKYFGFGDTESEMILSGEWETTPCETKSIDGITWNAPRQRISAYVTAQGKCFEMSFTKGQYPVVFVRVPNIQCGRCSSSIRFNFAADNSVKLYNNDMSFIPTFKKVTKFNGQGIVTEINLVRECARVGRIVYDTPLTGTIFPKALEHIV